MRPERGRHATSAHPRAAGRERRIGERRRGARRRSRRAKAGSRPARRSRRTRSLARTRPRCAAYLHRRSISCSTPPCCAIPPEPAGAWSADERRLHARFAELAARVRPRRSEMEDTTLDVARRSASREERAYFLGYGRRARGEAGDERRLALSSGRHLRAHGGELRAAASTSRRRSAAPDVERRPAARGASDHEGCRRRRAGALDRLPPRGRAAPLDRHALSRLLAARHRGGVARRLRSHRQAAPGRAGPSDGRARGPGGALDDGHARDLVRPAPRRPRAGIAAGCSKAAAAATASASASSERSRCRGADTPTRRSWPTTTPAPARTSVRHRGPPPSCPS